MCQFYNFYSLFIIIDTFYTENEVTKYIVETHCKFCREKLFRISSKVFEGSIYTIRMRLFAHAINHVCDR